MSELEKYHCIGGKTLTWKELQDCAKKNVHDCRAIAVSDYLELNLSAFMSTTFSQQRREGS